MESLSPNIFVNNINATVAFYEKLGFAVTAKVPEQGDMVWVMMSNEQVNFMFQTFESLGSDLSSVLRHDGGSLLFYIKMKDIRQYYERLLNQVKIIKEIDKTFYGATEFSIQDLNGYVLTFAEDEA